MHFFKKCILQCIGLFVFSRLVVKRENLFKGIGTCRESNWNFTKFCTMIL
jgi:hypothetical protein